MLDMYQCLCDNGSRCRPCKHFNLSRSVKNHIPNTHTHNDFDAFIKRASGLKGYQTLVLYVSNYITIGRLLLPALDFRTCWRSVCLVTHNI